MQNQNTKINFLVGLFVLGGIIALLFLALQAANLSSFFYLQELLSHRLLR